MKKKRLKRWIIKIGSHTLVSGGPALIRSLMKDVKTLQSKFGIESVWVTSGAIATAKTHLRFKKKETSLPEKQALSAIGQPKVMDLYNLALKKVGMSGAQILLTYDDLSDPKRRLNFQNTANALLNWGVLPILNENDAVATEEIRFGDNDSLSARVAKALNADRLVILTDVDGVFDSDPRKNKKAKLLSEVSDLENLTIQATEAGSDHGTGGMVSKLSAANLAARAGIETWLLKGENKGILVQCAENANIGTRIRAL